MYTCIFGERQKNRFLLVKQETERSVDSLPLVVEHFQIGEVAALGIGTR